MVPLVTLFACAERRYGLALRTAAINAVVPVGGDNVIPPLDFVFDTHEKRARARATKGYAQLKDHPLYEQSEYIGKIDYRDEKDFLPLQAADLIAWQDRRRLCARGEGTRPEYERLHKNALGFYHHTIGTAELKEQAASIRTAAAKLRAQAAQDSSLGTSS